jgi:hypothetical protein
MALYLIASERMYLATRVASPARYMPFVFANGAARIDHRFLEQRIEVPAQ